MFTWRLQLSPEVNDVPFICWHPASDFIEVTWRLELIHEVNGVPLICWCVMLACGYVGLPMQAIYGVAFLWSASVLLACCSFDSPMQAICLKLVERPAFDLLVSCWSTVPWISICLMLMVWPAVPSTCRCKRELWARFNLVSCPSVHVLLVLCAC
jgi:hypothetical protein